jgi:hypothetical protein
VIRQLPVDRSEVKTAFCVTGCKMGLKRTFREITEQHMAVRYLWK